jgi:hypothetical protein
VTGSAELSRLLRLEDRDHRARGGAHDPVDQVKRVLAALAEPEQRDILSG